MEYLPIDEDCYDDETWYHHPTLPVQVNSLGTHIFDEAKGKFQQIRVLNFRNGKWVELRVDFISAGNVRRFSRLALECFLGRKLLRGETVEHIDHCRTNNRIGNLLPRFKLFQGNNRRSYKLRVDGTVTGVHLFSQATGVPTGWRVNVRLFTPEGPVMSVGVKKYFGFKKYGGKEAALKAANDWKQTYTLKEGMVFV